MSNRETEKIKKELKLLKRKITELTSKLEMSPDGLWENITNKVKVQMDTLQGKCSHLTFYDRCWVVGVLYLSECPDFRVHNKNYKIEWQDEDNIKIFRKVC